jgi:hypothetical protein
MRYLCVPKQHSTIQALTVCTLIEQSFDWPMGLLIQSSKLSKFWAASHCEVTGCNPRLLDSDMNRPRRVVPSLLALFFQPPRLEIGR